MQLGMATAVVVHRGVLAATVPAEHGRRIETDGDLTIGGIAHIGARAADTRRAPVAPLPDRGALAGY